MTPSEVNDLATNLVRPALISVPGVAIPLPYGGIQETSRSISISPNCWRMD